MSKQQRWIQSAFTASYRLRTLLHPLPWNILSSNPFTYIGKVWNKFEVSPKMIAVAKYPPAQGVLPIAVFFFFRIGSLKKSSSSLILNPFSVGRFRTLLRVSRQPLSSAAMISSRYVATSSSPVRSAFYCFLKNSRCRDHSEYLSVVTIQTLVRVNRDDFLVGVI